MHAKALEIAWHDDSPIWSVDMSRGNRVVTASGDKVARLWRFHPNPYAALSSFSSTTGDVHSADETGHQASTPGRASGTPTNPAPLKPSSKLSKISSIKLDATLVEWLCDLRAHATTINIARFSPNGLSVATAADHGEIVIWRLNSAPVEISPFSAAAHDDNAPKERWQIEVTLRGHLQDVLDLAWSSSSSKLVSASVDNSVMIWDLQNPTKMPITLRNHSNFVQGVAIDPLSRLVASMGNDRALRIFTADTSTWSQVASVSSLGSDARLFLDDSRFNNFFRRLSWSPDGSVLACPSGVHLPKEPKKNLYAVHIFARGHWNAPVLQCGGLVTPACAVRFSPVLYNLRNPLKPSSPRGSPTTVAQKSSQAPFRMFTYRMVFAVACAHIVLFYDTEHLTRPFASVEGLHCAEHTDITWSADGLTLLVSAVDGYISVISFSDEELGKPLTQAEMPPWLNNSEELVVQPSSAQKIQKVVSNVAPTITVCPRHVETPTVSPADTPQLRVAEMPHQAVLRPEAAGVPTGASTPDVQKLSISNESAAENPSHCNSSNAVWTTNFTKTVSEKSTVPVGHHSVREPASPVEVEIHRTHERDTGPFIGLNFECSSGGAAPDNVQRKATDIKLNHVENGDGLVVPPAPGSIELRASTTETKSTNIDPMEVDGSASPSEADEVIFVCKTVKARLLRSESQQECGTEPSPAKRQKVTPGSVSRRRGRSKVQTKFCFIPTPNNTTPNVALAVAPGVAANNAEHSNPSSQEEFGDNSDTKDDTCPSPRPQTVEPDVKMTRNPVV